MPPLNAFEPSVTRSKTMLKVSFLNSRDKLMTWEQALDQMQSNPDFRCELSEVLRNRQFDGYFWECRPFAVLSTPFQFVMKSTTALENVEDATAFREHLTSRPTSFTNLGGDAVLIVPGRSGANHSHMASFVRTASETELHMFWKAVGAAVSQAVASANGAPLWVSSHGLAVLWLHVRIEHAPKYISYSAYKRAVF